MKEQASQRIDSYRLGVVDYVVFMIMIISSTGIGIYYGYIRKPKSRSNVRESIALNPDMGKTDTVSKKISEYVMGSRNLKVFPVGMSLIATFISGVAILGYTSEIYEYGTQLWLTVIAITLQGITVSYVYIPIYMALQVRSSYEYLELRFHSSIRTIASFMFLLHEILYMPLVIYVPALALNQVSGINLYIVAVLTVVICVFYTFVGGIKAVVAADALQVVVMFLSVVAVAVLGTYYAGGFGPIFDAANKSGRLIFTNTDPSPFVRHTVWSVVFGGFSYWTAFNAVNQTMVQRYLSLPSLRNARLAMMVFTIGVAAFVVLCCYVGLLIFQMYQDCDPLRAGLIKKDDQLMPLYVVHRFGHIYGMSGLFIAALFGAALSTLSSILNSTSLVLTQDIVRGCFKMELSDRGSFVLIKLTVFVLGLVGLSLVLVLKHLSGILSIAASMAAIASSTLFGIFTLGMLVPWANTIGTGVGGLASALITGWISFGTQFSTASGRLNSQKLAVSVAGCATNVTLPVKPWVNEEEVFPLYRLSFHWISPIGFFTALIVGTLVSILTKPTKVKTLDARLLSPVIHRFLPKECFDVQELNA